jgi:hypothetical protein
VLSDSSTATIKALMAGMFQLAARVTRSAGLVASLEAARRQYGDDGPIDQGVRLRRPSTGVPVQ